MHPGVSRSANNPHNIYRRQADLEVSTAMLYPHCQIWSQRNYRTFDGLTYISDGTCEVILIKIDDLFSINTINDVNCSRPETGDCTRKVKFDFLFETIDPIYLLPESEGGGAFRAGEMLTLPFYDSTLGIVIIPMNNYIVVELGHYGLSLLYDCDNYISIVALDISLIENSAQGLCGNIDGDPTNDLQHRYGETTETSSITFYTNTWIVGECIGESDMPLCTDIVSGLPLLLDPTIADRKVSAEAQCDYLKDASIFGPCHSIEGLVLQEYLDACYADVCARDYEYLDGAACSSIAAYVQECSRHFGGPPGVDWRTDEICPFTCPDGLEYMACPSACNDNSCNSVLHCDIDNNMGCVEGCRCPDDQFLKDGVCTSKEECPCEHLGESIPAGGVITDDCNTCECSSGKLQCTTDICAATCTVAGDPHYRTFDNKQYNFQGECMYTLLTDCWNEWEYDTEYAIRAENAICGTRGYSCIKAVSIEYGSKTVRLGRGHAVTLDGDIISSFPHLISDIYIDVATESSSVVHLGNGVSIMWDGNTRLEIHVQPSHYNHTCGLCGTFTLNQNDDYFTAAGDTESNPQSFGNKWKYGSACQDVSITGSADSCSINTQRRALATSECSVLQSEPFTACHAKVSPATYISNCKLDVCSCKLKENCHCHMIAEYASECWRKGVAIDWRNVSSQCAIDSCEADGLRYTQCLESCQSSCAARSFSSAYLCHDVCIEGCVCPEGLIRGITGNCIQPDDCECEFEGEMFLPGESRMERCGFCTCHNGGWTCELDEDCEEATCGENQEYVACLSPCPKTCDNVNDYAGCYIDYDNCSGGCQCQGDKMLHNGKCIPISSCPCYHGGLTYQVGDSVKQTACRECTCSEDGWTCDNLEHCIGSCVAWGDPHFKTFDSRTYDFQGDCEYILTETVQGAAVAPFHIIVKSIPCGSSGVTCTKSIALTIGDPLDAETVFLVKGRDVPKTDYPFSNFRVETVGSYVFVFTSIGITLMWDKGTFLEVQIAPQYKGQVQGLCGNYDDNADNDFMTRSGGQASDDAILFSNGWKVHEYCADPPRIDDACSLNPHRRAWAYRRCNELKSDRFKNCHAKVDVAGFYDKCVYDACGCDMGGDCDCLCTAIATYAYECNKFGVPVEWRRQDVCPIQCEECERYDPCISPCDFDCALLDLGNGEGGCNYTCVEGCTCPPGQYYRDGECVQDCEVFTTTPQPTTTEISTTTEESTTSPPVTTEETTTSPPTTEETTTSPPQRRRPQPHRRVPLVLRQLLKHHQRFVSSTPFILRL
ncbi:putative mucin-2 [Apostichopus japonicus]|uniref:Putative mucin-2 n=1 Tax=Stichopus japonicus TaxID=307972 RepID=A0A2G8K5Z4_STIJA|nr:putative mucin-2 [Apostichopus japonicus]